MARGAAAQEARNFRILVPGLPAVSCVFLGSLLHQSEPESLPCKMRGGEGGSDNRNLSSNSNALWFFTLAIHRERQKRGL